MRRDVEPPVDPVRRRAAERERALVKLSRITTGAALAGTFATVGFGGLAAITYSGTTDDPASVDDSTPQNQPLPTPGTVSNPTATQPPTQQFVPVQPPTIRGRGRGHVSSGGS